MGLEAKEVREHVKRIGQSGNNANLIEAFTKRETAVKNLGAKLPIF